MIILMNVTLFKIIENLHYQLSFRLILQVLVFVQNCEMKMVTFVALLVFLIVAQAASTSSPEDALLLRVPKSFHAVNLTGQYEAQASDIKIYFYNFNTKPNGVQVNLSDAEIVHNTGFSPTKDNHFVVHGWLDGYVSESCQEMKNALMKTRDCNIFVVDWSIFAKNLYIQALGAVPTVGKFLGSLIQGLVENNGLDLAKTSIVGHSLGAHIAGVAGASLDGQLDNIIGLDPAGPLVSHEDTSKRLTPSSAKFIQVIHTTNIYGFYSPIGHADYYPNGGKEQPGCGLLLNYRCGHLRSYHYYAESLLTGNFKARKCDSYGKFEEGKCDDEPFSMMGGFDIDKKARGTYYLDTNSKSPYAKN